MDDNKQQIVHYFIEEAQEHLETVEKGLLDLAEVISDAERVNEMFRAAHSIKGGAAMLGFTGIQSTAHKLEDCFKILRDQPVPIDRKLETLFLQGYDALKDLVEELANSPTMTLRPEVVDRILADSANNFVALQEYLEEMLNINTHDTANRESHRQPLAAAASVGAATAVMAPPVNIIGTITNTLQQMLALFKQGDNSATRQQLVATTNSLCALKPEAANWQALIQSSSSAIANTNNSYNAIAPLVIRELKQAGELLAADRATEIVVSAVLQQAITAAAPAAPVAAPTQITIPVDARGAAQAILQSFNRQQVTELVVLLHRVISNSKQN